MVKKASFLQRLRDRWGSGSGVRVAPAEARQESRTTNGGAAKSGAMNGGQTNRVAASGTTTSSSRVEPERAASREVNTNFAPAEVRSSRKLSEREEAMMALGSHFQELTALVRGSHARTDEQMQKLVAATEALSALPTAANQQVELLRQMGSQLEKQNALGEQVATTLHTLPTLLQNVESALARAAATDERTASTVREFHSTMERIHGSMRKMVEHSDQQAKAASQLAANRDSDFEKLSGGIERAQQAAASELQRTNEESLASLRRTHEDQSNRLQRVVQEHAGWNRAVLVGIGLVVLGIGALLVLQLVK